MRISTAINRKHGQIIHTAALCLIAVFGIGVSGNSMTALAQEATPPVSEQQGQIIYAAKPTDNYEIYAMNEDGSNVRNLTHSPTDDQVATWSPDGTQIAFQSKRDGNWEVYVMDPDGSNPRDLSNNAADDQYPRWSPDGAHLAFASNRDGNFEIYVMNADGSDVQRLTNNEILDLAPAWTPDGKQVVYESQGADQRYSWIVMNADGSDVQQFLPDQPRFVSVPHWSPDGKKIAFDPYINGLRVVVIDADGSNAQQLTQDSSGFSDAPAWSPDGTQIVFVSNRGSTSEIYVMNSDGTDVQALTHNAQTAQDPSWALTIVTSASVAQETATVNSQRSVNMRGGAGTNNPVIAAVPSGTTVTVLGFSDDQSWVNVRLDDGQEGWISASLLIINTP